MTEQRKFTWFPTMSRILLGIPNEADRGRLFVALLEYGTYGIEPELEYPLSSIFDSLRDHIDNSIGARERNSGGRPRKNENVENHAPNVENYALKNPKNGGFETENGGFEDKNPGFEVENPCFESENGGFEVGNGGFEDKNPGFEVENPCFESENGGFEVGNGGFETENPSLYTKPYQSIPSHTKINQTKPNQEGARARAGAQAGDDDARFIADALDIFNAETGLDVRDLTPEAMLGLQRIRGSGRTLEDVRRVVRAKRDQWSGNSRMRSYIRPSTLFGERFEEYFAETGKAVSAYAEYD